MAGGTFSPQEGGCTCTQVRYVVKRKPLFVHCCHCNWCQRETGSAFALNALIEAGEVALLRGSPEIIDTPSSSGNGQQIVRCPICKVAIWSHYSAAGAAVCFVRTGTLDHPGLFPPDIHIFTFSKQPWVRLETDAPVVAEYYQRSDYWPADSIARYKRAISK